MTARDALIVQTKHNATYYEVFISSGLRERTMKFEGTDAHHDATMYTLGAGDALHNAGYRVELRHEPAAGGE